MDASYIIACLTTLLAILALLRACLGDVAAIVRQIQRIYRSLWTRRNPTAVQKAFDPRAWEKLTLFEGAILLILVDQPENAYGKSIRDRLEKRLQRPITRAIYRTLRLLESEGFVSSQWGEGTVERHWLRKRYYAITEQGAHAVSQFALAPLPDAAEPLERAA